MRYRINLSKECDHLLRQLCDSGHNLQHDAVSPEDFLSAFVEEQLGEMFVRHVRRKAGKTKRASNAVQSAKERAKTWSEAVIATHTALEAMRKKLPQTTRKLALMVDWVHNLSPSIRAACCEVEEVSKPN